MECKTNDFSSRVCERGTKCCVIQHGKEDKIKDIATEFYYHWHNSGGTNTADGFDSWWKLNKARFGFAT